MWSGRRKGPSRPGSGRRATICRAGLFRCEMPSRSGPRQSGQSPTEPICCANRTDENEMARIEKRDSIEGFPTDRIRIPRYNPRAQAVKQAPKSCTQLHGRFVGQAILPAAGFQPASRLKGGCGQDCPPHVTPRPGPNIAGHFGSKCSGSSVPPAHRYPEARRFSMSRPSILQSTRRKYSWRGYDMNERESVSMPTKRDSRPTFESALICHSMASF